MLPSGRNLRLPKYLESKSFAGHPIGGLYGSHTEQRVLPSLYPSQCEVKCVPRRPLALNGSLALTHVHVTAGIVTDKSSDRKHSKSHSSQITLHYYALGRVWRQLRSPFGQRSCFRDRGSWSRCFSKLCCARAQRRFGCCHISHALVAMPKFELSSLIMITISFSPPQINDRGGKITEYRPSFMDQVMPVPTLLMLSRRLY